jgi:vacuolar-type H+-ATPase subunit E/Vma4
MMQESSFKAELLLEIDQEVEQILAAARRDAEALLDDARRRRKALEANALRRLEEELAVNRRRALARAELEGRNALLRLKREAVDRVFADVRKELARMATEESGRYLDLLESIFRSCRHLLPAGPVRVRVGPGQEGLCERLRCAEEDIETIADPDLRGMILETADGRLHCDGSIEGLLKSLRREREADIEGILFGDGNEREG